eukprot:TRINITY_DN626_c0_g1_i4.p1 TRINITY_DN626_c0_g1~~TRINITY_DN626_c0_g1_i4.p1  ORF type:complete len:121 (-),score=16.94 TRINITY_DN626_c0_g1_i4:6-368(-)
MQVFLKDEVMANNEVFQYICSVIHYNNGNLDQALRCALSAGISNSLDGLALLVQIYLAMNRVDLAEEELSSMQKLSDDAIQTQLANAWIAVYQGGDKYQEALYIYPVSYTHLTLPTKRIV